MPALLSSEDPGLLTVLSSCPEHMGALCSVSLLLPAETRAGKRQHVSISRTQLGLTDWAALSQGIGSASGSTSSDRPQAGSATTVWFDSESHPSVGSKHEPHPTLVCISHLSSFQHP